ncbi:hypothetical protein BD770DRAFT_333487 [Pilaira anomala]|nr:hypothetical protein BD770DRAFT_333487 [Pilaira anomala]
MVGINLYITLIRVKNGFFFNRYEVRTHLTKNQKWDGVGFNITDQKSAPILIEFSKRIDFNNHDTKENNDANNLSFPCKKSIDYITARTYLTLPVLEFVVRFYDSRIYFDSVIKLYEDLYIRRIYSLVPIPIRPALPQEFLAKAEDMYKKCSSYFD